MNMQRLTQWWILGGVLAIAYYGLVGIPSAPDPAPTNLPQAPQRITALGRLEPESRLIRVAAPLSLDKDRVARLLVEQGETVKQGQILAILDSHARLQAALQQARGEVLVAQASLARVRAGAKQGEIQAQQAAIERIQSQRIGDRAAQQATIARLEAQWQGEHRAQQATIDRIRAELSNAEAEAGRYAQLATEGAISASLWDSKRLAAATHRAVLQEAEVVLERIDRTATQQLAEARATLIRIQNTAQDQIQEATATLAQIREVRPVDVQVAQAELDRARAAVLKAQADLETAVIRAPRAGRILKVHSRVGERLSDNGIADLGQTDRMVAVAEVYQTDIGKVKVGQPALITSQAFVGQLRGTVSSIGLQISRQNVFSNQPGENLDGRIVEVRIQLEPAESQKVAMLTHLQVQAEIKLAPAR